MPEKAATIEQVAQQLGSTLLPDNERWTNRFEIASRSSGRKYIIAQVRESGEWGCSCPGWTHHRKCKHLTDMLSRLAGVAERYSHLAVLVSARTAFLILDAPTHKAKYQRPVTQKRVLDLD